MGKSNINHDLPLMDSSGSRKNIIEKIEKWNESALSISIVDLHASTTLNPEQLILYFIILLIE